VQLSLLRRDGYIAAPRGGRDLDENDDAVFYRAFVLHLGELAVDVLLRIVVGPPLGTDFRAVKRALRKAYPLLCRNCAHETKTVRRRNAGPRRGDPYHLTRSRRPKGTRDNTQKGYLNWHAYVDAPGKFSHRNSNAAREPPKRKRHEKQTQDTQPCLSLPERGAGH
jgi:hypothetical protein